MGINERVSSPPRLPGLDGLRGLAAIGVVAVHVWMYTENTHGRERWPLLDAAIGELRLGLMFFFVVSGFLLAGPWVRAALEGRRRPRLGRFTRQRAARVLPAYLVALVGAFAVLYGTGHAREVGLEALPVFALFAQNHVDATAGQLNPPTWSLAVEVGFYLLLPIVGWAFVRARTRARLVAICVALIGARAGVVRGGLPGRLAGDDHDLGPDVPAGVRRGRRWRACWRAAGSSGAAPRSR